jgi:uncharacterized protein (TIGR03435 family)
MRRFLNGARRGRRNRFLIGASLLTVSPLILVGEFGAPSANAQTGSVPPLSFEVASVKLNQGGNIDLHFDQSGGGLHVTSIHPKDLIEMAYGIRDPQLEGAPAWISSERYDIEAKLEDSVAREEEKLTADQKSERFHLRLQALLADRFQLKITRSTKELSIFALVVAKGGPKFSPAAPTQPDSGSRDMQAPPGSVAMRTSGGQWIFKANGAPINQLLFAFGGRPEIEGRVVVDETGLTGTYTFTLHWIAESQSPGTVESSDPSAVSLFSALQEQLGLKLESRKSPLEVIVIDHIEKPSGN